MASAAKTRLAQLRKRLSIPRNLYLSAVRRQEDRAWAKWTEPVVTKEVIRRLQEVRDSLGITSETPVKLSPQEPAPALFDADEEIQRDDAIIDAFLADNPNERRIPMARGRTHEELFYYWKSTETGRNHVKQHKRRLRAALERTKQKILGDSSDPD